MSIRIWTLVQIPTSRFLANFVDGTVEGTDIHTGHMDGDLNNDHTYYGNGCPNGWDSSVGPPTYGGSTTACSIRIVQTADGEDQSIGTYYHFNAAASGSGGTTIIADNSIVPDSFCPLGWQLPYGGTGGDYYDKSKSWKYLLNTIYGIEYEKIISGVKVASYPFSLNNSGSYYIYGAVLFSAGVDYTLWGNTKKSDSTIYRLNGYYRSDDKAWVIQGTGPSNNGQSVRCVKFLASSHRRHGGRKSCRFNRIYRFNYK